MVQADRCAFESFERISFRHLLYAVDASVGLSGRTECTTSIADSAILVLVNELVYALDWNMRFESVMAEVDKNDLGLANRQRLPGYYL